MLSEACALLVSLELLVLTSVADFCRASPPFDTLIIISAYLIIASPSAAFKYKSGPSAQPQPRLIARTPNQIIHINLTSAEGGESRSFELSHSFKGCQAGLISVI